MSLKPISEPTKQAENSNAHHCLKKKKKKKKKKTKKTKQKGGKKGKKVHFRLETMEGIFMPLIDKKRSKKRR
ncbi:hypothetical protein ID0475_10580 [Helicobacter pylori]